MAIFETVNELYLRVTHKYVNDIIYAKVGAMVGYKGTCRYEKVLLGPDGDKTPFQAMASQALRRLTGENLPLMVAHAESGTVGYYANGGQHVVVIRLPFGQKVMVESESLLAFTQGCRYSCKFIGQGIVSQKGLFTSTLMATDELSSVAILTNGNPLVLESPCKCDPDALVAWVGEDPRCKIDANWKNLINQASGESYFFEWGNPGSKIVIQPTERASGIGLAIDGNAPGNKPSTQQSPASSLKEANQRIGQVSNFLNGLM